MGYSSVTENGVCWKCLFAAAIPLALLAALIWFVGQRLEAGRSEASAAAASERANMMGLEDENDALRMKLTQRSTELASMKERLDAAARGAMDTLGGGLENLRPGDLTPDQTQNLLQRLRPGAQTAAQAREAVEALDPAEQARFFAGAPQIAGFTAWARDLPDDERRGWLSGTPFAQAPRQEPEPAAVSQAREAAATIAELRESRDALRAERDALARRRDALQERLDAALTAADEDAGPGAAQPPQTAAAPATLRSASDLTAALTDLPAREAAAFFERLPELDAFTEWFSTADEIEKEGFVNGLPEVEQVVMRAESDTPIGPLSMTDARARIDSLQKETVRMRRALEGEADAALRQDVAELTKALTESSESLKTLRGALNRAEAARLDAEAAKVAATQALEAKLAKALADADAARTEAASRIDAGAAPDALDLGPRGQLDAAQIEQLLSAAEQAAQAARADATQLRARVAALENRQGAPADTDAEATVDAAAQRLAELERRLTAAQQRAAALETERARLTKALEDARSARETALAAQREAMRAQLEKAAQDISAAQTETAQKTAEITRMRRQEVRLERRIETLEARSAALAGADTPDLIARLRARFAESDINLSAMGACEPPQAAESQTLSSGLAFASGSDELSRAGEKALDQIAAKLKADLGDFPDETWRLVVEGHTDKRPVVTDRYPSNWELSALRASAVVRYLASQGIAEDRMIVVGRGPYDPIDPGEDAEAYELNRRIEINVTAER